MIRLVMTILTSAVCCGFLPLSMAEESGELSSKVEHNDQSVIVGYDSGRHGDEVPLQASSGPGSSNYLRKHLTIDSLDHLTSAELQIFGALRAPDGDFTWDRWKWIWFSLIGHQWVRRVEDVPLARTRGNVEWEQVEWASVKIPNNRYLNVGLNELTIWTTNPPEYGPAGLRKFLVVAVDDSGQSSNSFSRVGDEWTNMDLNGDRDGTPCGEWMNRLDDEQRRAMDALGPARLRKMIEQEADFAWSFTDAMHRVFPDRPYTGPLDNTWTIDAARNEYESCQFVISPISTDLKMLKIFINDFVLVPDARHVDEVAQRGADEKKFPDGTQRSDWSAPRGRVALTGLTHFRCPTPSISHRDPFNLGGLRFTFRKTRLRGCTKVS